MAAIWGRVLGWTVSSLATMGLTEAGPPANADGIDLVPCGSIRPILLAPPGQTLTGAGDLRCWIMDRNGVWRRHADLDEELVEYAGKDSAQMQPVPIFHNEGRMAFLADGVGVSGGATLTVVLWALDRLTKAQI